jgi:hypothetical protein
MRTGKLRRPSRRAFSRSVCLRNSQHESTKVNERPVKLLWTGGLDSTYRLLELVLLQKRLVQPYYLIDSNRRSTALELRARDEIQGLIRARSPDGGKLLLPTSFHSAADIRPNADLTRCYDEVRSQLGMGNQHELLALLADQLDVRDFEICGHWNDPAVTIIEPFLTEARDQDGSPYFCAPADCPDRAVCELFKYFRFPMLCLRKTDLLQRARQHGLMEILSHTWFCHRPVGVDPKRAKPCGTCNTCLHRINTAGMAGFGWQSRLRYDVMRLLRPGRIAIIRRRQGLAG